MGTTYKVIYFARSEDNPSVVSGLIQKELKKINQSMSTYIEDSEISKINKMSEQKWVGISKNINTVFKKAVEIHKLSHGYFDITLGPVINLWGFGPKSEKKVPTDDQIKKALSYSGLDKVEFDFDSKRLKKKIKELNLDLSALAKGYGVDQIAKLLNQLGIHNYFVEIGGEISTRGKKYTGPWLVGIETPTQGMPKAQEILKVSEIKMATSGNYRNFFVEGGMSYSHTINHQTGRPVPNDLASVSVIDEESCMQADALATALMAMGKVKAMELSEKNDLAVYMIYPENEGFKVYKSSKFKKLFDK